MFLTTLLLKHSFKIIVVCISLWACNLAQKVHKIFEVEERWQNSTCDTTLKVNSLSIYDIVQPFYLSDTLLHQKLVPQKVFVAIIDQQGNLKIAGVTAQTDEHPQEVVGSTLTLTWQEQEYLWALAAQPRYLYTRWEKLLSEGRAVFLVKRDSIYAVMKNLNGSVKIISDLRSMANQQRYLEKNKTASPISMHNFGFAADFAVFRNNKISNNLSFYHPLDELTAQQSMTWGGNFVGFLDPGHIQMFKNGAEMLRKYPDLIFEFEPHRLQYESWMNKMIGWGKEAKANDTKELLIELNKYKNDKPCSCQTGNVKPINSLILKAQNQAKIIGYQQDRDLLLMGDVRSKSISMVTINGEISYPLGRWK